MAQRNIAPVVTNFVNVVSLICPDCLPCLCRRSLYRAT